MISGLMNYSLATYKGNINGNVGGNLTINTGGAIQSAVGNIDIQVGGNLNLNQRLHNGMGQLLFSARSGRPEKRLTGTLMITFPTAVAGALRLNVGGSVVSSDLNPDAWLVAYNMVTIGPNYGRRPM